MRWSLMDNCCQFYAASYSLVHGCTRQALFPGSSLAKPSMYAKKLSARCLDSKIIMSSLLTRLNERLIP